MPHRAHPLPLREEPLQGVALLEDDRSREVLQACMCVHDKAGGGRGHATKMAVAICRNGARTCMTDSHRGDGRGRLLQGHVYA